VRWQWPWWRRADDHTAEALKHLAELDQREPEVASLGRELLAQQRANHFSAMVYAAIARGAQRGGI
jgi:hypothetical protein